MMVSAIIAAAGSGRRMGKDRPKQYLEVGARPIICHTLDRFLEAGCVGELVVVVEPDRIGAFRTDILEGFGYPRDWRVVAGGKARQQSVANGLMAISPGCDVVLVHDGVRPFIGPDEIRRAAELAVRNGACIIATPLKETIKRVDGGGIILETVDRSALWGAKTPQAFRRSVLQDAMDAANRDGFVGTDEASLVERLGIKVSVIEGSSRNIKITTPGDLLVAEVILREWKGDRQCGGACHSGSA